MQRRRRRHAISLSLPLVSTRRDAPSPLPLPSVNMTSTCPLPLPRCDVNAMTTMGPLSSSSPFPSSFGKKRKLSHLPPLWHRLMVGYPKARLASTTTPALTVQLSPPKPYLPTAWSLPYASIQFRSKLMLRSQWNRALMVTRCRHTS
jgi:hypothetical protein